MMSVITSGVTELLSMGSEVLTAIFSTNGTWSAVQPLIGIGIATGVVGFAVRTIKSLSWGF